MRFLKYLLYFALTLSFQSVYSAEGDLVDVLVKGKGDVLTKVASGTLTREGVAVDKVESENKSTEIYVLNKSSKELAVHNLMVNEQLAENKEVKTQVMTESKVQDFYVNVDNLLTKGGTVTVVEGKMVFLDLTDSKDVLRELNSKLVIKEKKIYVQAKDSSNVVRAYKAFYLPKSLQVSSGVSIEKPSGEILRVRDFTSSKSKAHTVVGVGIVDGKIGYGTTNQYGLSSEDAKGINVIFEPGTEKIEQKLLKIRNGALWHFQGHFKAVDALLIQPLWEVGKFLGIFIEGENKREMRSDMVLAERKKGVLVKVGTLKENGDVVINQVEGKNKFLSEVYTLSENSKELLLHKVTLGENKEVKTQVMTKSKVQDFFVNVDNLLTKAGRVAVIEGKMVILDVVNTVDVKDTLRNLNLTYREKKIYVQVKDSSNVVKAYDAFYLPKSLQVASGVVIEKPSSETLEVREFFNKITRSKAATAIVDGKIGLQVLNITDNREMHPGRDNIIFEPGTKKVHYLMGQIRNGYILTETGFVKLGNMILRAPIQLGKFLASPFARPTPVQVGAGRARRGK